MAFQDLLSPPCVQVPDVDLTFPWATKPNGWFQADYYKSWNFCSATFPCWLVFKDAKVCIFFFFFQYYDKWLTQKTEVESPHHGSWSGGCWGALQTLSGCRWGTVENETSSNQCQDAGRLQIMTSMGTDMESGIVTSDEHFGILCSMWLGLFSGKHWAVTERSSTLPRSHSLPHSRHLRQFNVCTFSIVKSSYKAYEPVSFCLSAPLLHLSFSMHHKSQPPTV